MQHLCHMQPVRGGVLSAARTAIRMLPLYV